MGTEFFVTRGKVPGQSRNGVSVLSLPQTAGQRQNSYGLAGAKWGGAKWGKVPPGISFPLNTVIGILALILKRDP